MNFYFSSKLTPEAVGKAPKDLGRNTHFYNDFETCKGEADPGDFIYTMAIAVAGRMETQFVPELTSLEACLLANTPSTAWNTLDSTPERPKISAPEPGLKV